MNTQYYTTERDRHLNVLIQIDQIALRSQEEGREAVSFSLEDFNRLAAAARYAFRVCSTARLPLLTTNPVGGGPIAPGVLHHNAYVDGWVDGTAGNYLPYPEEAPLILNPEWAEVLRIYREGHAAGERARKRTWARAAKRRQAGDDQ